jgi:hypothetical protein
LELLALRTFECLRRRQRHPRRLAQGLAMRQVPADIGRVPTGAVYRQADAPQRLIDTLAQAITRIAADDSGSPGP